MKSYCETCGNPFITKSHLVKNNSVAKTKKSKYNYNDEINFFPQCINCHQEYELLNKNKRIEYLVERRLYKYAARAKWLITI